jgi:hypothetical protein
LAQTTAIERAFILDLESGQRLFFQNMPEEIAESKAANWNDTDILGRSEPLKAYGGSTARAVSLTLQFAASIDSGDGGTSSALLEKMRFVRSLVYPTYTELTTAPSKVLLSIGQWFKMVSIVRDVAVTYKRPWTEQATEPMLTTVAISLEEANSNPYGRVDILSGLELTT